MFVGLKLSCIENTSLWLHKPMGKPDFYFFLFLETSKGRQEERIWLMKGRRIITGKMWGALGLVRFRSERSWDEYFYQLAAARLQRRDVSVSVTLFWTRTAYIGTNKKKTGIGVWALAKISARNVTGDHSEQSHALKNRIKIFFCSFLIEVNVFKLQTKSKFA